MKHDIQERRMWMYCVGIFFKEPSEINTCMQDRRDWRAIIDVRQMSNDWLTNKGNYDGGKVQAHLGHIESNVTH